MALRVDEGLTIMSGFVVTLTLKIFPLLKLSLVPRETPFSLIHLRNLTALAEAGARIVAAIPAWYHKPQTIENLVDFVVARALDQFEIDCVPVVRWKEP